MARPRVDIDRSEMVELYRKGLSIRQLMAEYDCSYGLANRIVSARTKLRPRGGPNIVKGAARPNHPPDMPVTVRHVSVAQCQNSVVTRERVAELRAVYEADLAGGLERFFEPARDRCPWCESAELSVRLVTGDLHQAKPGRFTLRECRGCGHVFQDPRLSAEGLEFYYRDYYDGLGEDLQNALFALMRGAYRGRAELVRGFGRPGRWLDVGTGHGHFPEAARKVLPDTVFDGVDMSDGIEIAERHGRIARGHRGMFPELAGELAGGYDVVSMNHYLEHTTEPLAELDAAATVLRPGGHLLIEVPDPVCRLGRVIGRAWMIWCQPQHLHLFPVDNLKQALISRGFTVVAEEHGRAHLPGDFTFALLLTVNSWAPGSKPPWLPRRPGSRSLRAALLVAAVPVAACTVLLDAVVTACVRRGRGGNTYRLLARSPG